MLGRAIEQPRLTLRRREFAMQERALGRRQKRLFVGRARFVEASALLRGRAPAPTSSSMLLNRSASARVFNSARDGSTRSTASSAATAAAV